MKRIFLLAAAALLCGGFISRAQDASASADRQAAEERYQKLAGKVEDLAAANELQQKRIAGLESQLRTLREEQGKPDTNAVGRDELRQLAEKVKEIDEKRAADKELILNEISELGKTPVALAATAKTKVKANYDGYEYVIKPGDTLLAVVAAYREKGVKVSVDDVLKNPLNAKLDPVKLRVGQKIFIPGAK